MNKAIDKEIILSEITAPVKEGEKIGEIVYRSTGEEVGRVDIVAKEAVEKVTFGKLFANMMLTWVKVGR